MADARFLLGANYYPIDRERQSWGEWYAADPAEDFAAMSAMGMSLVRVFFSWRMFEPQVGQYDDDTFERLDRLVASAKRNGLALIVALFAEDEVAELLALPWRQGRSVVTDDYMLQRAIQVAQRVGTRYRGERAILGWDLLSPALAADLDSPERFSVWFGSTVEALREAGAEQMVGVGVDAETLLETTKVRLDDRLAAAGYRCTEAGAQARAYMTGDPSLTSRATYLDGFLARAARRGVPVIADAVGIDSLDETCEREAAYLGVALASLFANRAAAGVVRRWRDLDTEWRDPYTRLPFESPVGLQFSDGSERPSADEVRSIAQIVDSIDLSEHTWERERAAVIMPAERYAQASSLASLVAPRSVFAAFVVAKQVHIPLDVIAEHDDPSLYDLVIVPSVQTVEESTWAQLSKFVDEGGTLMLSYGGGDATQAFCELFGLEFMGDQGMRSDLATKASAETVLGSLPALQLAAELPHFALVSASGAGILAVDTKGNPLLTVHGKGQGKAIFLAAPFERVYADVSGGEPPAEIGALLRRLYQGAARVAGAASPYECDAPELELGVLHGEDGASDILLAINHEAYDVQARFVSERPIISVTDLLTEQTVEVGTSELLVPMRAHHAKALRLALAERRQ